MEELSRIEAFYGEETFLKIENSSVLVLGLGGVGGYVCEALARSGVKKLILVDYDTIEKSNFNRQIIADYSTLGMNKTEAMKKHLLQFRKSMDITCIPTKITKETIHLLFQEKVDFIVDACDDLEVKKALIFECMKKKQPWITCLGTALKSDPTKLMITTLEKTREDPLAKNLRKWAKEHHYSKIMCCSSIEPKRSVESTQRNFLPSTIIVPASAGLLIAYYVLEQLIKE